MLSIQLKSSPEQGQHTVLSTGLPVRETPCVNNLPLDDVHCTESLRAISKRTNEDAAQAARTAVRKNNFIGSWVMEATKVC